MMMPRLDTMQPTLRVLAAAFALFLFYQVVLLIRSVQRARAFRAFAAAHDARPVPGIPLSPYLLGLDHMKAVIQHMGRHTLLEHINDYFGILGTKTFLEPAVLGGLLGGGSIVTCDPANIKAVLATQFDDFTFAPGRQDVHPFLGAGIFTSDGNRWAAMRGRLRPWFGRAAAASGGVGAGTHTHAVARSVNADLYDLAGRAEESLKTLLRQLEGSWKDGATVDLVPPFFKMLMEIAVPMIFGDDLKNGIRTGSAGAGTAYRDQRTWHPLGGWGYGIGANVPDGHDISYAEFEAAFDNATEWFSEGGEIEICGYGLPNERFYRECQLIKSYVGARAADAIARHSQKSAKDDTARGQTQPVALIDHLAAAEPPLPHKMLSQEAFHILFAARDTTAGTLCDLFWELARHPRVLARLRQEILAHFPSDSTAPAEVTFERVKQLKYLNAAIKETLRLHPVLPMNGKHAARDTTLPRGGGPDGSHPIALREGTNINWVTWGLHRIPEFYNGEVDEMKPERWLDGNGDDGWLEDEHHSEKGPTKGIRPGWAYVPFNGGPRTCIGQQFALGTLSYVAVRMIQEMDKAGVRMESRDDRPWTEKFSITAKNLHGCLVGFVDEKAG